MSGPRCDPGGERIMPDERSVLAVLAEVRSGRTLIDGETRQRCVEHLTIEGCSTAEIAQVLSVSERTVMRDRSAIRERHALEPSSAFTAETVGTLIQSAEGAIGRLKRLAREKGSPPSARIDAEHRAWMVQRDLIQLLQRLGYLPMAQQRVHADLMHRVGGEWNETPTPEELEAEVRRLAAIHAEDSAFVQELEDVRSAVQLLSMGERIKQLTQSVRGGGTAGEEHQATKKEADHVDE